MRHSYGIIDRRKVLLYRPQLFKRSDDVLVFPSREFNLWQSEINEYLDGIYQINAKNLEKGRIVDVDDVDLAIGLLVNINEKMETLFRPDDENKADFAYNYVSIMDDEYKKRRSNYYSRYMHKIDRKVPEITPQVRYMHMMEIVDYAHKLWSMKKRNNQGLEFKTRE